MVRGTETVRGPTTLSTSVLIASHGRPPALAACLESLERQIHPPDQVIVVWQGNDAATGDVARDHAAQSGLPVEVVHSPTVGIVPAENTALTAARGDVVLLIDDDARGHPRWVARHVAHYADPTVGAVGGPALNYTPEGLPFPTCTAEPVGTLRWYGRAVGNMHDHPPEWRDRAPADVDHLVGYNLSLRRAAFDRFEPALRPYWQAFELDACLQVRGGGYRVLFDFANVVRHYPTNPTYAAGREGDLTVKIYNPAYNRALILAKHSPWYLRAVRLAYLLGVGTVATPGVAAGLAAMRRYGQPGRELRILVTTMGNHWRGWRAGARIRSGR